MTAACNLAAAVAFNPVKDSLLRSLCMLLQSSSIHHSDDRSQSVRGFQMHASVDDPGVAPIHPGRLEQARGESIRTSHQVIFFVSPVARHSRHGPALWRSVYQGSDARDEPAPATLGYYMPFGRYEDMKLSDLTGGSAQTSRVPKVDSRLPPRGKNGESRLSHSPRTHDHESDFNRASAWLISSSVEYINAPAVAY
ncbi:hypothetical protein AXG93_3943s1220 [Marchantia polymorpha subsp. ruderalis]|uniref:Uncharacterized protein n=1 Tax=Marchantia polymorpha subsp. ruderalis TaxID=1480154 RepID=A0A176WE64_MARPO|nr:hypothetical protein AXG93_3943s1220 [Marchantia polymorpha subsp. ruderalis]